MKDKQQLAAMGAEMAEQQQQPLCMAKRIEELEWQVRVMAELLRRGRPIIDDRADFGLVAGRLLRDIDAALVGKLPTPVVPEGWQLVPVVPGESMCKAGASVRCQNRQSETDWIADVYRAMLAAAPKPEAK